MIREIEMLNHVRSGEGVTLGKMATEKYNSPMAAIGNPLAPTNDPMTTVFQSSEQALKRNHAKARMTPRKIRVNRMP
jgi:hypothetical protein